MIDLHKIKIDTDFSLHSLFAIKKIYSLYLEYYLMSWDDDSREMAEVYKTRLENISNVLMDKYRSTRSLNERIRILENLEEISLETVYTDNDFALENASELEELPTLTYSQSLRLSWLPDINPDDVSGIVRDILSAPVTSFDIETLLQIINYCTEKERSEIIDLYISKMEEAFIKKDVSKVSSLLVMGAPLNIHPDLSERMKPLLDKVITLPGLTFPVKLVNTISQDIYSRLDVPVLG